MSVSSAALDPRFATRPSVRLRPWQRAAFDRFTASTQPDYLAVATPGAGKTTFALTCARWALGQERRRLIVVAPTSHLKSQWAQAAHRLGLQLDPEWTPTGGLARDVHGLVTTYQHVATAGTAKVMRGLADDAFVILDEIHHAGDERAWGDAIKHAFEPAARRLALSGTPFRSDTAAIPFVRYDTLADGDTANSDYTYGYADALRDGGVVRPVYFPRIDGVMEWSAPDGSVISANFHDELAKDQMAHRLRTALSLDGDWLPAVLRQAHDKLTAIRTTQPDAGGLVIAMDQAHAQGIAQLIRRNFGVPAEVVVSDDPTASDRIAKFATTDAQWLVAVRMVSEGVDIPRLRVGVYATTVTTELFFRQAVGRFVRWQTDRGGQKAYVFLPDDPRLRHHAFAIAEARRHVLRPPATQDDTVFTPEGEAAFDSVDELGDPEQLSLFSALSAVATGITVHTVTADGTAAYDDEPDAPDWMTTGDDDDPDAPMLELDLVLPDIPTDAGFARDDTRSVAEVKDDLRAKNAYVAQRLVDLTGLSHPKVNAEMNRLAGVTKVTMATTEQLERRLRYAESWLRRARGGYGR